MKSLSSHEDHEHVGNEQNIEKWLNEGPGIGAPSASPPPATIAEREQQQMGPSSSMQNQVFLPGQDSVIQTRGNAVPTSTSMPQAYRNSVLIPIEASASGFVPETLASINQSMIPPSSSSQEMFGLRASLGMEVPRAPTVSFNPQISYVANPATNVQSTWTTSYNSMPRFCSSQPTMANPSNIGAGQRYPAHASVGSASGPGAPTGHMFAPGSTVGGFDDAQWNNWNQSCPPVSQVNRYGMPNHYAQQVSVGPSAVQIAARQVMPRELPKFNGDPEGWPMFRSAFYNTTQACGYSHAENLARLQRSLDGPALVAVKSRLLLPESVPQVVDTLERLYGRPEILIHSLLRKLRDVPAPKTENLRTIIDFGLAVQNLVDHMTIAKLTEHLRDRKSVV